MKKKIRVTLTIKCDDTTTVAAVRRIAGRSEADVEDGITDVLVEMLRAAGYDVTPAANPRVEDVGAR